MLKIFFALVLMFILSNGVYANRAEIQSTQGIEIDQSIAKVKSDKIKNEHFARKPRYKNSKRINHKILLQDRQRTIKQKELEYYEQRLEDKKKKLELLDSNTEKGEQE